MHITCGGKTTLLFANFSTAFFRSWRKKASIEETDDKKVPRKVCPIKKKLSMKLAKFIHFPESNFSGY